MRRIIVVCSVISMLLGATAPASAGSLKVRTDPNDSRSVLDIRKVITNLTARRMRLQIATGRAYDIWDVPRGMGYAISLDTVGNRDRDVVVELLRNGDHFDCLVESSDGDFHSRRGVRPSHRSAACLLPRSWFEIHRRVRFHVWIEDGSDRAPTSAAASTSGSSPSDSSQAPKRSRKLATTEARPMHQLARQIDTFRCLRSRCGRRRAAAERGEPGNLGDAIAPSPSPFRPPHADRRDVHRSDASPAVLRAGRRRVQ